MKPKRIFVVFLLLLLIPVIPVFVFAQESCTPTGVSNRLCNPFGAKATDLRSFAIYALTVFGSFTVVLPIVFVVFSGMAMVVSQGNPESVKRAKTSFTWTVYGFILAVLSFVLIQAMITFLGASDIADPSDPSRYTVVLNPLAESDFGKFIERMLINFLRVAGILAVLMLIFNGLRYITAGGDEEQAKQGKEALKWSTAGVIVILLAYVIIRAMATLLGLPQ